MKKAYLLLSTGFILLLVLFLFSFTSVRQRSFVIPSSDTLTFPVFKLATNHLGKNNSSQQGLLTLTSGLDNDYYLLDSTRRTGYLYVETRMAQFANTTVKKNPLNISLVIDRSGSMAGEKMDFAKKAAMGLIDKLTPEDYVSIVIYDEFIELLQPSTAVLYKDSIKAKIARIKPRGSTNLWGGSEKGYEQVKAFFKKNYVNRVLLISDGNITAGPKIPSRIIAKAQEFKDVDGITISTFGVGLDYNETLMTDIAENGGGNYYYIDKVEKMGDIFNKEINGLLNVVAQNAELHITVPKGVTIESGYPFKYLQNKTGIVIQFRDLFSEELKGLILKFRIDDNADKELLFQTRLTYIDAIDNQAKQIENSNVVKPLKDVTTYLSHFNSMVAEQVFLFTANENMEKAMYEADRGNYEAAKRYTDANDDFFATNVSFVTGSAELKKMDSVNRYYYKDLSRAKSMSADSVKLLQKGKRAMNYQIRNKKIQ